MRKIKNLRKSIVMMLGGSLVFLGFQNCSKSGFDTHASTSPIAASISRSSSVASIGATSGLPAKPPVNQDCETFMDLAVRERYNGPVTITLTTTSTGFSVDLKGKESLNVEATLSEGFDPVAVGFSLRFKDLINLKNNVAVQSTAFLPNPLQDTKSSGRLLKTGYKTNLSFHIARLPEFANLTTAVVELSCHGRVVSDKGFTNFQQAVNANTSCSAAGGTIIENNCQFGNSCLTYPEAQAMLRSVGNSYYSRNTFQEPPHQDCFKGYGEKRNYIASCAKINSAETARSSTATLEERITGLYLRLRLRNPDKEGLAFWISEISKGARTEKDLEDILR